MGLIKRYCTAWRRQRRSRGFGIHSPFAYRFVREVLGQSLPYYCYEQLDTLHATVVRLNDEQRNSPKVIANKDAKQLFRITNEFNPDHIMQVGAGHAMTTASMLAVSSTSRLWLYQPVLDPDSVAARVIAPMGERVTVCNSIDSAISAYEAALAPGGMPFVYIDGTTPGDDYKALTAYLQRILATRAVVIMRGIDGNDGTKRLWLDCKQAMPMGQTYTNEKTAILIATPKLQREDFVLWL